MAGRGGRFGRSTTRAAWNGPKAKTFSASSSRVIAAEPKPQHLVVMGVSGSGKSTVAAALAERLKLAFADGDGFHPPGNVAKLARGEPLTDADREPWLRALASWIAEQDGAGRASVLACSALKRRYRDTLRQAAPQRVRFVYLAVPAATLRERLQHRTGHFVGPELLESQLATLETLEQDEPGITVEGAATPVAIVEQVVSYTERRAP